MDLEKLNAQFAKEAEELSKDFNKLFKKWFLKSPRLTMIMSAHLPINLIMHMISENLPVYEVFPELPDMFIRFVAPFIKLRKKWGKIPGSEFQKEYQELYESQFKDWIPNDEERQNFKDWFERTNKPKV